MCPTAQLIPELFWWLSVSAGTHSLLIFLVSGFLTFFFVCERPFVPWLPNFCMKLVTDFEKSPWKVHRQYQGSHLWGSNVSTLSVTPKVYQSTFFLLLFLQKPWWLFPGIPSVFSNSVLYYLGQHWILDLEICIFLDHIWNSLQKLESFWPWVPKQF